MNTGRSVEQSSRESETTRGVVNWAVKGLVAKLFVAAVLFASAGRLDWVMGWVYLGVFLAFDVATGGPYRYVRHPGYLGAILFTLLMPILLGSLWALIPAGLAVPAHVVRAALEDRTLHAELDGHAEYVERVRYRLLPGVW